MSSLESLQNEYYKREQEARDRLDPMTFEKAIGIYKSHGCMDSVWQAAERKGEKWGIIIRQFKNEQAEQRREQAERLRKHYAEIKIKEETEIKDKQIKDLEFWNQLGIC